MGNIIDNKEFTFLTTEELSARIKYDVSTIRKVLKDSVLLEGRHYIRPFGQRKLLFLWEPIYQDIFNGTSAFSIPLAHGGYING